MAKACCIFGPRVSKLHWGIDEANPEWLALKKRIVDEVTKLIDEGVRTFFTDMSDGVNLVAAEIVVQLKNAMPEKGIRFVGVLPHEEQAARWINPLRERYFNTMAMADDEILISNRYTETCYREAAGYMIEHSTHMIIISDANDRKLQALGLIGKANDQEVVWIDLERSAVQGNA